MPCQHPEHVLGEAYRRYARVVAMHPLPFVLVPIALTLISGAGIVRFHIMRDADILYADYDARFLQERRLLLSKWANSDDNFHPGEQSSRLKIEQIKLFAEKDPLQGAVKPGVYVCVTARDGGSVLRPSHARELYEMLSWIRDHVNATHYNETTKRQELLTYRLVEYNNVFLR